MVGYIYKTTNLINGMMYIGRKTSSIFLGVDYLGSGVHLNRAIKKYGKENFTVELLEECFTPLQLIIHEYLWIKNLDCVKSKKYYNHSPGGLHEGFVPGAYNIAKTDYAKEINSKKHKGKKMPEGFSELQSEIHKGKPSGMLGKKQTAKQKAAVSESNKTRDNTQSSKKTSEQHKGSEMLTNGIEQHWFYGDDIQKMKDIGWWKGSCKKRAPKGSKKKNKI